jgi:hypothetical protein
MIAAPCSRFRQFGQERKTVGFALQDLGNEGGRIVSIVPTPFAKVTDCDALHRMAPQSVT